MLPLPCEVGSGKLLDHRSWQWLHLPKRLIPILHPKVLENEFRIMVLENVIELLLQRFPSVGGPPISPQDMERIRYSVAEKMQSKYPDTEISLRDGANG